jgi:hypothetical protein
MIRLTAWCLAFGASIPGFCGVALAQESRAGTMPLTAIVESMEKTRIAIRPQVSYQVVREYRLLGASNSSADSDVVAEVDFRPPASKAYRIRKWTGSDRGPQVVRRVLEHEVEAASNSNQVRTALSRDNYDFTDLGETTLDGRPCYLLGLKPRRKETDLVSGQVWVDKHAFVSRQIEGEVAKTPSWWLKKVHVKLTFAEVEGTWLQTGMEAVADVRMMGSHTLKSRILDYRGADEVASSSIEIRSTNR